MVHGHQSKELLVLHNLEQVPHILQLPERSKRRQHQPKGNIIYQFSYMAASEGDREMGRGGHLLGRLLSYQPAHTEGHKAEEKGAD